MMISASPSGSGEVHPIATSHPTILAHRMMPIEGRYYAHSALIPNGSVFSSFEPPPPPPVPPLLVLLVLLVVLSVPASVVCSCPHRCRPTTMCSMCSMCS